MLFFLVFLLYQVSSSKYEISLDKRKLDIYLDEAGSCVTKDGVSSKASSDLLEEVKIHPGITEIQESAFLDFKRVVLFNFPNGLQYFHKFCFRGCTALKSIEFPYGLIRVFGQAFSGCTSLETVTLSATVQILDLTIFESCISLARFNFSEPNPKFSTDPTGQFLIENGTIARFGPAAYSTIRIPSQIKTISGYLLNEFKNVTTIDFSDAHNLTRFESQAFRYSSVTRITYPEGVEYVGNIVLEGINVEFVSVPSTLLSHGGIFSPAPKEVYIHPDCPCFLIAEDKIVYNKEQTEIAYVPNGVQTIKISSTVDTVNIEAITACKTLRELTVDTNNPTFSDHKNVLYSKSQETLIACPGGLQVVEIYSGCSFVQKNSMRGTEFDELLFEQPRSKELTFLGISAHEMKVSKGIVFPDTVANFYSWSISSIETPFIVFPSTLQRLDYRTMMSTKTSKIDLSRWILMKSIPTECFWCSEAAEILLPPNLERFEDGALKNCSNIISIEIPSTVLSIGDSCFYNCTSLSSLKFLGTSIKAICSSSFKLCNLERVEVPASIETLPMEVFSSNPNLREIIIPSNSNITEIQLGVFKDCDMIESIHLPPNLQTFAGGALYGMGGLLNITIDENPLFECEDGVLYTKGLEELVAFPGGRRKYVIHKAVKAFRESAFFMCKKLEEVTYEGEVVLSTIGVQTFLGCERFAAIMIPGSVSSIAAMSFGGCTKLTNVSFGEESLVTKIVSTTFDGCERLERVRFGSFSHLEEIEEGVFAGLKRLRVFEAPLSLRKIGRSAFWGCSGLKSFRFFNLTEIEEGSFERCSSLGEVSLGPNLTVLGNRSFESCSGLVTISYCGFRLFASDAFPTNNRLLAVRVPLNYSSEKIGGIMAMRVLDSDCQMATVAFTAAEGTKSLPLLWSAAALNGSEA